jgi:hypothetical protein
MRCLFDGGVYVLYTNRVLSKKAAHHKSVAVEYKKAGSPELAKKHKKMADPK